MYQSWNHRPVEKTSSSASYRRWGTYLYNLFSSRYCLCCPCCQPISCCSSSYSSLSAWYIISCIIKSFFIIPSRAYSSADWAGDVTVRRSTTGFCVFLGFLSFRGKVRRRKSISRSSAEAEYHAIILLLRRLLLDLGVVLSTPTPLYCDNRSAIQIASNSVFHERTKHIEIDSHYVRHHFLAGTISLPFISLKNFLLVLFLLKEKTRTRS